MSVLVVRGGGVRELNNRKKSNSVNFQRDLWLVPFVTLFATEKLNIFIERGSQQKNQIIRCNFCLMTQILAYFLGPGAHFHNYSLFLEFTFLSYHEQPQ